MTGRWAPLAIIAGSLVIAGAILISSGQWLIITKVEPQAKTSNSSTVTTTEPTVAAGGTAQFDSCPKPEGSDDGPWMRHANLAKLAWSQFPAAPFTGSISLPDFNGAERANREFRTALTDEARLGPDFAGHYRAAWVGCGMGCAQSYIIDEATGRIEHNSLELHGSETINDDAGRTDASEAIAYRPHSRLVLELAHDTVAGMPTCFYNAYEWTGHALKLVSTSHAPAPPGSPDDPPISGEGYCS